MSGIARSGCNARIAEGLRRRDDLTKGNGARARHKVRIMIDIRKKMSKVALLTGITGQDGSYLAELLLEKGYEVR